MVLRLGVDTEVTGVDFWHGAKPFFVSVFDPDHVTNPKQVCQCWEWDVNPLNREPLIPASELAVVRKTILKADQLILQNPKFDAKAFSMIECIKQWPWEKTRDTLTGAHLLGSNTDKDLTTLALVYCRVNIKPVEDALEVATKAARRLAKQMYPHWMIAKKGLHCMPSCSGDSKKKEKGVESEKPWHFDMWLPRAMMKQWRGELEASRVEVGKDAVRVCKRFEKLLEEHESWDTVLREYGSTDPAVTVYVYDAMVEEIKRLDLWEIYETMLELLDPINSIETNGITISGESCDQVAEEFSVTSTKNNNRCVEIAAQFGYELKMPKGGINNSLKNFIYDVMRLEKRKGKKTEQSLDKYAMEYYRDTLPPGSLEQEFIQNKMDKQVRDTALTFLDSYHRYWIPLEDDVDRSKEIVHLGSLRYLYQMNKLGYYRLHPSLNATGTDTLRFSSYNPNGQNISKQKGFTLRKCFGPAPGREWYSLDYENIELRIPAYGAGEELMIQLFEKPHEPPYFGSQHLLFAHLLHDESGPVGPIFERCLSCIGCGLEIFTDMRREGVKYCECTKKQPMLDGRLFKDKYNSTWYGWTKNGDFAVQYGAMAESGTADRAYHVIGGQAKIETRLTKIKALSVEMIAMAERVGYVETMPDHTVNPRRGYPLLCTRTNYGDIKPTVPLSYHVQGTAMWCTRKAMIRCHKKLREWSEQEGEHYFMTLQVHDEIVFDFPKNKPGNLEKVIELRRIMMQSGDDIGIPLRVSVSYHPHNWSDSEKLAIQAA